MAINFGNDNIKVIYVGSDEIKEVYYGSELVWSGFNGGFFPNGVEWQESRNHGAGSFDIGEKLILHAENTIAAIETTKHYDISEFNKLRLKWEGYRNPADDWGGITIKFLREDQTSSNAAPGVYYSREDSPNNFSETAIWDLSDVYFSDNWVEGVKYRVEVYIFGSFANQTAHCEIEEITLLEEEEEDTNAGYWVHKDTLVRRYFGLEEPSIVNGVMSKPSWALDCSKVKIPSGVTGLGLRCFQSCISLTSIEIPEGVTSLGIYCFERCTSLTSINIPQSVISLGTDCFNNCSSLTSITLPENVTSMGNRCFQNCSSLILATVLPTTPPSLGSDAFGNTHASLSIKVLSAYVNAYKTATRWIDYASKISAI